MAEKIMSLQDREDARVGPACEASPEGLRWKRYFSSADTNPFDSVRWTRRTAAIRDEDGNVIFQQQNVEAPEFWSDTAVNVVVSRYFRGEPGSPAREKSVRDLITRVADTIRSWGEEQAYFASSDDADIFRDELVMLLLHQKASFNSPVWFNVGVEATPQCSACFILSVEDSMESILDWYKQEGMIFKGGSGSGINLSSLRSAREALSGGGTASGPVSFMRAADASAGVIKSGGKTRRAAKMVILDVDHPDILEFISCKAVEEAKERTLAEAGFSEPAEAGGVGGAFRNSNHSVRVTDEFMEAVEADGEWSTKFVLTGQRADTMPARTVMKRMAEAAHACGDPGIQFHTTCNRFHTCPNTGPIRASNPCSEYMHVDDSACNLASLRLTGFLDDGLFDTEAFRHAVDVMITAQEILIDRARYPGAEITRNSQNLRALGLGFADLGAMLMRLALPYDSEEGRNLARAVTAVMTGEAYVHSARIASIKGPFEEFHVNRDAMLDVILLHRDEAHRIAECPSQPDLVPEARWVWESAFALGERYGYRNCQTTVIAPTGTVGFMMDCDTTGIEPELALVKYKRLAEGGTMKIVNRCVPRALSRLGYDSETTARIVAAVEETGTVEQAPDLLPEHLPVFDCAFRPVNGARIIAPHGHLAMMGAVQPFVSGAISKTVNLPSEATVGDVERIFISAWKMGLKAVTVYRDGCKAGQPLGLTAGSSATRKPVRKRLPNDCRSVRHKFQVGGQEGYIHTGFYQDGSVGEIFICMAKEGSTISGLMDTIATLTSIALQYGVPLEALVSKFSHVRFEPSGFTTNPDIPIAKSLTDYIFRYLGTRFLSREKQEAAGLIGEPDEEHRPDSSEQTNFGRASSPRALSESGHPFQAQSDAPSCRDCGAIMVRNGTCYRCLNCGATSGCS